MKNFQRGRSTFKCNTCGHLTRLTGAQSMESELCPDCYELAGYENEQSDNDGLLDGSERAVRAYIAAIEKKGGDASEWRKIFEGSLAGALAPVAKQTDEDKVYHLLMSRSIVHLERADIQRLTGLGEEACYRILRKLVADGRVRQEMHTGRTPAGRPYRVARYSVMPVRVISI